MKTILLIDDDTTGLAVRLHLMRTQGYNVLAASTGAQGIRLSHTQPIHLVLLDYNLPDMTGEAVMERLRAEHPTLPIVMLSGVLDLPQKVKDSVTAVLIKGDGAQKLIEVVSTHLR